MAGHGDYGATDGNAEGLYSLAARQLMAGIAQRGGRLATVRYVEIYRGQVLDLLARRAKLEVNEDGHGGVHLVGGVELPVESYEALLALIKRAEEHRATGCTSANETSSRSHAILQVRMHQGAH
jgi:kinesin family protein 2/24